MNYNQGYLVRREGEIGTITERIYVTKPYYKTIVRTNRGLWEEKNNNEEMGGGQGIARHPATYKRMEPGDIRGMIENNERKIQELLEENRQLNRLL